jgi:Fe-S protein assembly co-chaperone HscB
LRSLSHFQLLNSGLVEFSDAPGTKLAGIKRKFLDLQVEVHPDSFAAKGGEQKRRAEDWSGRVNEAYQTLRDPLSRALYIVG